MCYRGLVKSNQVLHVDGEENKEESTTQTRVQILRIVAASTTLFTESPSVTFLFECKNSGIGASNVFFTTFLLPGPSPPHNLCDHRTPMPSPKLGVERTAKEYFFQAPDGILQTARAWPVSWH